MTVQVADLFPLAPIQEGLLFHALNEVGTGMYVEQSVWWLEGPLSTESLGEAWQSVVDRHPVLRTSFAWEGLDRPLQVVHETLPFPLRVEDPAFDCWKLSPELEAWLREDRLAGFDLRRPPLLRVTILRHGPERHVLVWTFHHIVLDGWSWPLLLGEVLDDFEARLRGRRPVQAPTPAPSIRSYVEWIEGFDARASEAYWRDVLAGAAIRPLDLGRPDPEGEGPHELALELPQSLSEALRRLGRELRVTPNVVVQGAWSMLLSRYLGTADVLFGRTVSMRHPDLPEAHRMLGPLVNTVPTRVRVPTDATSFRQWARRQQHALAEAWEHSRLSLPHIRRAAGIGGGEPLFDALFVFENAPVARSTADSLSACGLDLVDSRFFQRLNYPLCLVVQPRERVALTVVYEGGALPAAAVERMAEHLVRLLDGIVADVDAPVAALPILTPVEDAELAQHEGPAVEVDDSSCIHDLVSAAAGRHPDADAVLDGDARLTYGELDRRANRLAHHLRHVGVVPETLVGVLAPRSIDAVVAMLAVLKAGGGYVPLDPAYPARRLSFMAADAGLRLVVAAGSASAVPFDSTVQVVHLGDADTVARVAACPDVAPAVDVDPDGAAYVIYTSGSTGTPKGVLVSHRSVTGLLAATQSSFEFGPDDVWALFHSLSFDFSVWELWGALGHGGSLVVVPHSLARSPSDLVDLLVDRRVTVLNQTPTAFVGVAQALRDAPEEVSGRAALRYVIFGGEPLRASHLAEWRTWERRPPAALVNMYGITETTVHVTVQPVDGQDTGEPAIGRPIGHTVVRVVDPGLHRVPAGVTGELLVGGPGCARGYVGNPRLTAERFVPDPFSPRPGARLYRSGDLGRRRPDGTLEHRGRSDQQVKVRGFRIEPGEVEAVLKQHPDVRDAVVVTRSDDGHLRLVGYVVGEPERSLAFAGLRQHLADRLPAHMVPHLLVEVDRFPLTPSGKLDPAALPHPDSSGAREERPYRAPRTSTEEVLASIWADVLGVPEVGVDDDFFDLGGDSILSIRIVALASDRGISLPPGALFDAPTVARLAQVVARPAEGATPGRAPAPFELVAPVASAFPSDVEDAYPLTALQAGMLFHNSLRPEAGTYHDVFRYRVHGPWDERALCLAVDGIVRRHVVLRTTYDLHRYGSAVQLVRRGAAPRLEIGDIRPGVRRSGRRWRNERRRHEGMLHDEPLTPFDWEREPPVRIFVHRVAEDAFDASLSFHHAVLDGWSVVLLFVELAQRYEALLRGATPDDTPLRTSYARFVELERAAAGAAASASFWARHLEEAVPCLVGHATRSEGSAGQHVVDIGEQVVAGLRTTAARLHVPLKSLFLAAHLATVAEVVGRDAVTTGVVTHGRPEEPDGDRILGLFLNTVPFHLRVGDARWRDLVVRAYAAERAAFPHRRYPLADILRGRPGDLFDWLFNYTDFHLLGDASRGGVVSAVPRDGFESTNFPLVTGIALGTTHASAVLAYDAGAVDAARVPAIADLYVACLEDLVGNLGGAARHGAAGRARAMESRL